MLEETMDFLNVDLAEDISMSGYPKISEVAVHTCTTYYIVVIQHFAKFTEIHLHRSLFSTCNL